MKSPRIEHRPVNTFHNYIKHCFNILGTYSKYHIYEFPVTYKNPEIPEHLDLAFCLRIQTLWVHPLPTYIIKNTENVISKSSIA
jgi:hypothetical protein